MADNSPQESYRTRLIGAVLFYFKRGEAYYSISQDRHLADYAGRRVAFALSFRQRAEEGAAGRSFLYGQARDDQGFGADLFHAVSHRPHLCGGLRHCPRFRLQQIH